MEFFKLLSSVLLLITEAHAWGAASFRPVDCLVTGWTSWSEPIFGDTAIRTRSVLRMPVHNGKDCPDLREETQTGTPVTTEKVAVTLTESFLSQYVVRRKRSIRQTNIGQRRDLLVILDASGSIGLGNFELATDQLANLLGLLCPTKIPFDNDIHKLAVIRFSDFATEIFDFNAYTTTSQILQAVRRIKYTGEGTNTAAAFNLARDMLVQAKGARLDDDHVKQEVLILTDGRSNDASQAIAAANGLKEVADVFGLIIGQFSDVGRKEVLEYVSDPIQNHLFWLESFAELTDLVEYVQRSVETNVCAPFDLY